MPKFKPNTGYGKKPAAPKYVQPGIDPNTTAANIAAQQNVQPANTNPPPFMKTVPFKMKHNNSSFPFKSSPAKDAPEVTHPEHHDESYVKNPDQSGAVVGEVSTPTLDAINRKLNKLKNTNTEGMSNAQLTAHSNKLKEGNAARDKEFNKMRKARGTS